MYLSYQSPTSIFLKHFLQSSSWWKVKHTEDKNHGLHMQLSLFCGNPSYIWKQPRSQTFFTFCYRHKFLGVLYYSTEQFVSLSPLKYFSTPRNTATAMIPHLKRPNSNKKTPVFVLSFSLNIAISCLNLRFFYFHQQTTLTKLFPQNL